MVGSAVSRSAMFSSGCEQNVEDEIVGRLVQLGVSGGCCSVARDDVRQREALSIRAPLFLISELVLSIHHTYLTAHDQTALDL